MIIYRTDLVDIELTNNGNIHRTFINRSIGKGDNLENRFGVRLFNEGEPVDLTGATCIGLFMAPDGQNILVSDGNGTCEGNTAYVTLPQACYNVEGQFSLAIKVIKLPITGTMRIIDGIVDNTGVDSPVAPVETVPTYQEILALYDEMLAARDGAIRWDITQSLSDAQKERARTNAGAASEASVTALNNTFTNKMNGAFVRPFSTTEKYEIGDIVAYQGQFWKFILPHSPGAFDGDQIAPADSIPIVDNTQWYTDMALTGAREGVIRIDKFYNSTWQTDPMRMSVNPRRLSPASFIPVFRGDKILIHDGSGHKHQAGLYSGTLTSYETVRSGYYFQESDEVLLVEKDGFVMVAFANTDETTNISRENFTGWIEITSYAYRASHEEDFDILTSLDGWELGSFDSNSQPTATDKRVRNMNLYPLEPGSQVIAPSSGTQIKMVIFNDLGDYVDETGWIHAPYTVTEKWNVRFLIRQDDESVIPIRYVDHIKFRLKVKKSQKLQVHVIPQYSIGDCHIVRIGSQTILIDTGRKQDYYRLRNALRMACITRIDYVIVSHFHRDHVSPDNVNTLISEFDLRKCTFILPPAIPSTFEDPDNVYSNQQEILSALTTNNISYINTYGYDMRSMILCGIRFDFYNLDHTAWYAESTDYNQMSIVCVANVGKTQIMFTGDMGQPLETKLLPLMNRKIDICKIGHHGLNDTINTDFWHKIHPEVVWSCSPEAWHDELYESSHQIRFMNYNHIYNLMTKTGRDIWMEIDQYGYRVDGDVFILDNLTSSEYFDYVIPG